MVTHKLPLLLFTSFFHYFSRHKDFVVREAEFLTSEWDVADAMRLLDLAGGDAAFVADPADEQRLSIFRLASGEGARGDVGAACGDPVVGPSDQNLE